MNRPAPYKMAKPKEIAAKRILIARPAPRYSTTSKPAHNDNDRSDEHEDEVSKEVVSDRRKR